MTSGNINEDELRQREQDLHRREQEIRLRELEAELHKPEPPLHKTVKHDESKRKKKGRLRKVAKFAKYGAMVFGAFLIVRLATQLVFVLVPMIVVGLIAFIGYKLYLENDDDD